VGTLELLSPSERARVKGFVINRFRGDIALLQPGLDWLEARTGIPVLGVLPYLLDLHIEAEDAINLTKNNKADEVIDVVVPVYPRISNHTDFDPLRLHPQVSLQFVGPEQSIPAADLIILPGSKNVRADLQWLKSQGWDKVISKHCRYGGKLLGICGGFQILGKQIHDPDGIEGSAGSSEGLGLLDIETVLTENKQLRNVSGRLYLADAEINGYEIHAGISKGKALQRPFCQLTDGADGAISEDKLIIGSYVHGLFNHPQSLSVLIEWVGMSAPETFDYAALCEQDIERLADVVEQCLDTDKLIGLFR
jgi:adenosylcobyric acid synthase